MYRDNAYTYVIVSIGEGDDVVKASLPQMLISSTFSIPTTVLRWPTTHAVPSRDEISSFRTDFENAGVDITNSQCLVIIQGDDILAFDLFFGTNVGRLAPVIEPQSAAPRFDEDHRQLADRKVAIVGCGSMGSKIATMLARSGVGEFILVDDDILLPENLVRNDLDWREVALHKVDGLADRLELVQPAIRCKRYRRCLGGQESSASIENLIEVLVKCDLVIDATAETDSFSYLGSLAKAARLSMVWGEIFAGGFGGFIARYRPGIEPSPMTMRHMIHEWCNAQGQSVPLAVGRYESGEATPAIADDAEVGVIASHLALFALDTLLAREPSGYPCAVYMIALRAGWVFDQPFEVRPIDVGRASSENDVEPSVEEKHAEIERILKLMSEYTNADSSTS
jgi:molybdopterin/thiamine biosynthesis adenylyltransferase